MYVIDSSLLLRRRIYVWLGFLSQDIDRSGHLKSIRCSKLKRASHLRKRWPILDLWTKRQIESRWETEKSRGIEQRRDIKIRWEIDLRWRLTRGKIINRGGTSTGQKRPSFPIPLGENCRCESTEKRELAEWEEKQNRGTILIGELGRF